MMKITQIHAREVLDSRGNPTVEAEVTAGGMTARAIVPSGASTGSHEAHELRDGGKRYGGKGVAHAVEHINTEIRKALRGKDATKQAEIDALLCELDGTPNKSRLGANAILAVSLAVAHVAAQGKKQPLFKYVRSLSKVKRPFTMPLPLCNVINGGKHAAGSTDIQEFMIAPVGAKTYKEAVRMLAEVFHALKSVVAAAGYGTTVGDEGGYAPHVKGGNAEALDLIARAVAAAGYKLGKDIVIALDVAASELMQDGAYVLATEGKTLSSAEMVEWYAELAKQYPIVSIEDGLGEDDWEGWQALMKKLGKKEQLVGDDLLVTNVEFLERGIETRAANAILIKPNQIGTLTETIQAVDLAHKAGWHAIISHRSGETEDTTIAHLAVGLGTGQIKTGSMSRTDRVAKYNELLRIEEMLGEKAVYAGKDALK